MCGRLVLVEFVEQGLRCRGDALVVVLGCPALDGKNGAAVQPPGIPKGKAVAGLGAGRPSGYVVLRCVR